MNGTGLGQVTHDEAAGILKNAIGEVKIVVSQFKSEGTSFLGEFLKACNTLFILFSNSHLTILAHTVPHHRRGLQ